MTRRVYASKIEKINFQYCIKRQKIEKTRKRHYDLKLELSKFKMHEVAQPLMKDVIIQTVTLLLKH